MFTLYIKYMTNAYIISIVHNMYIQTYMYVNVYYAHHTHHMLNKRIVISIHLIINI